MNKTLNIFIKFNQTSEDFSKIDTMKEHIDKYLEKGEVVWGQFTKNKEKRNKKGLWNMRTPALNQQLNEDIPTFVFFYNRKDQLLYASRLINFYDRDYVDTNPELKDLIPSYYHSRVGTPEKFKVGEMRSYTYIRITDLVKIDVSNVDNIYNFKNDGYVEKEKVLESKGMASLLYTNLTDEFYNEVLSTISNHQIEAYKHQFSVGTLQQKSDIPHSTTFEHKDTKNKSGEKKGKPTDYTKKQIKNKVIGDAGEDIVLNYEKEYLKSIGLIDKIKDVRNVARETNDTAGYDILSFDEQGNEKHIEVKTTEYGIDTPFMIEENEVRHSRENADKYHLYRLYNYNPSLGTADWYEIEGNIEEKCKLTVKTYKIYFTKSF